MPAVNRKQAGVKAGCCWHGSPASSLVGRWREGERGRGSSYTQYYFGDLESCLIPPSAALFLRVCMVCGPARSASPGSLLEKCRVSGPHPWLLNLQETRSPGDWGAPLPVRSPGGAFPLEKVRSAPKVWIKSNSAWTVKKHHCLGEWHPLVRSLTPLLSSCSSFLRPHGSPAPSLGCPSPLLATFQQHLPNWFLAKLLHIWQPPVGSGHPSPPSIAAGVASEQPRAPPGRVSLTPHVLFCARSGKSAGSWTRRRSRPATQSLSPPAPRSLLAQPSRRGRRLARPAPPCPTILQGCTTCKSYASTHFPHGALSSQGPRSLQTVSGSWPLFAVTGKAAFSLFIFTGRA